MAQIARELGLTQATVSLALRNHPRISEATRERVKEAAQRLGYHPDPLVSPLMAQRRSRRGEGFACTLGVISLWPDPSHSTLTLPFFAPNREGIAKRAAEMGFAIDSFACDGTPEQAARLHKILIARGIQGLIFGPAHRTLTRIPFPIDAFSVACIGDTLQDPVVSHVTQNSFEDMLLAWSKLREDGLRRIGYFYQNLIHHPSQARRLGAYLYCREQLPRADRIPPLSIDDPETIAPVETWIRKYKPQAILSTRVDTLITLHAWFPDIRMVGLILEHTRQMEGILLASRETGIAVVEMVAAQLHRGDRGVPAIPKHFQICGRWVSREEVERANRAPP